MIILIYNLKADISIHPDRIVRFLHGKRGLFEPLRFQQREHIYHKAGANPFPSVFWHQRYGKRWRIVVYMTVIHELGEIKIGDYTPFQITREEKTRIERAAVHDMLKDLLDGPEIEALFLEFDAHETAEAKLAYQCDKAIACLKSKWYDEEGCVDLTHQEGCQAIKDPLVQSLLQNGESWSGMFIKYTLQKIDFDDNFREVLKYAATHRMHQDD